MLHQRGLRSCWVALILSICTLLGRCEVQVHDDSFQPDALLRVSAKNISLGGITRYTTVVNGTVPGPVLRIPENAVSWIRVYNDMTDRNLTMHWHGLAQAASPFSDGTPLASQWPIPPLHFFDYELQTPDASAGSYFYHSHVGFQTVSASGPLIVEDAEKVYQADGERIVFLQELFNKTDTVIEQGLAANPGVWSGETNGFVINGRTISNYGVSDNSTTQLAVIKIEPNTTYRFRFITATSLSLAALGIENHTDLKLIEADGSYTKPHSVDFLQLGSGQRLDALVTTKNCNELAQSKKLDYYIQIESRERPANTTNFALLRYSNACNISSANRVSTSEYPAQPPVKLPPTVDGWLDHTFRPLQPNDFPSAAEVTRRVIIDAQEVLNGWAIWRDFNVTWLSQGNASFPHTTPQQPYLVSLYQNQTAYMPSYSAAVSNGGRDPNTDTFPAKIGEVLEIVFQNVGAESFAGMPGGSLDAHPWHAHGQHYYDIGGGPGAYDPNTAEKYLQGDQPVLRDTTMLYRGNATTQPDEKHGWRAWRLRVQQPGVWMIHCHTLQHMLMGMQTVWVFGEPEQLLSLPKVAVQGYLTYGGSAYGNSTHAPHVVHFSQLNAETGQ